MILDFNQMTAEEKEQIRKKLAEEDKQKEIERKKKIQDYKSLVDETVLKGITKAKEISKSILEAKKSIFGDFSSLLELKSELYGVRDNQQSHTFSTSDGKFSITLGHRMLDNFDDTVHTGIAKAKNYIARKIKDENKELQEIIELLLKKDKNGNLKASRVLELEKIATKINDEELTEAVEIIKEAWKPERSRTFIEAWYKDNNGNKINIPLSVTAVMEAENGENKETSD